MSTESTIASNLAQITDRISRLETQGQREAGSVRLLAVSKRKPAEMIRVAVSHGQHCFGENYAEEGASKRNELSDLNLEWHYIGHIQSNKTRLISSTYDWVQSVDREKIAQRLAAHRSTELPPLNVCLQVNIDAEESKSGCAPEDLGNLAAGVASLDTLVLRGIMAIPAPQQDMAEQRKVFRKLHNLYLQLQSDYPTVDTLSMGMTGDMEAAIVEGATMVRIGTAIFGQRD